MRKGLHSFHIPVLGLAYSIDTPVKVARFGIASAVSIMDHQLLEDMRAYYCRETGEPYQQITPRDEDSRAVSITAYLDLLQRIVTEQLARLRALPFDKGNDLMKYFELLPEDTAARQLFDCMLLLPEGPDRLKMQQELKLMITAGDIDVNIMSRLDKVNYDGQGNELPREYADAHAALRGFANSKLHASVIFSAGYNPALYAYTARFPAFYPDEHGRLQKRIILKVSDYRSAIVQGKILAKKGLWVSEFRVESGLNCGGHAFATDGLLLGPVLEEFRSKRAELTADLYTLCQAALYREGRHTFLRPPALRITVQGGIGTAGEHRFLTEHYGLDGTGWGSPFLLVPEATNVDPDTLQALATAKPDDYFCSDASPLGVPFNNFRNSSAEQQRQARIAQGRPGSPCYKKFLASDTEFGAIPECTASRKYQYLKIRQLREQGLAQESMEQACAAITAKDCLCEGLGASVRLTNNMPLSHNLSAVTICPGPNLAYFSGIFTLREMTDHIYGRVNILNDRYRPNLFVNELHLYIGHLEQKLKAAGMSSRKQIKTLATFKENLLAGIGYYKKLSKDMPPEQRGYLAQMTEELDKARDRVAAITLPE